MKTRKFYTQCFTIGMNRTWANHGNRRTTHTFNAVLAAHEHLTINFK